LDGIDAAPGIDEEEEEVTSMERRCAALGMTTTEEEEDESFPTSELLTAASLTPSTMSIDIESRPPTAVAVALKEEEEAGDSIGGTNAASNS
jgi:hypothetical protein